MLDSNLARFLCLEAGIPVLAPGHELVVSRDQLAALVVASYYEGAKMKQWVPTFESTYYARIRTRLLARPELVARQDSLRSV